MAVVKMMTHLRWLLALMLLSVPLAQASVVEPKQLVEERYQSLLQLIETEQLVAGMPEQELLVLMEKELAPVVDFPRVARKVMGKYARNATDEQLSQFTEVFKRTLVSTYAKGLEQIDQLDKVDISEAVLDDKQRRAKVNSEVRLKDGKRYQVVYSLFLKDKSQWMVENIVVEGVNIGIVYRNQFSHYMEQFNDDIDKVISNWGLQPTSP